MQKATVNLVMVSLLQEQQGHHEKVGTEENAGTPTLPLPLPAAAQCTQGFRA